MKTRYFPILLALVTASCGPETPAETYVVRGIYDGARFEGAAVRVNHEEIPGYMPAMQMNIALADTADVSHLEPGQKVSFHLVDLPQGYRAYGFSVLPDTTELDLANPHGVQEE